MLLVEDEESVRDLTREALEHYGYTVLDAGRPSDALRICQRHGGPVHLLLTDVVMPEMNGYELARRVTAARPGIRVLFVSGYANVAGDPGGPLPPRAVLLEKPFAHEALLAKVREVLEA